MFLSGGGGGKKSRSVNTMKDTYCDFVCVKVCVCGGVCLSVCIGVSLHSKHSHPRRRHAHRLPHGTTHDTHGAGFEAVALSGALRERFVSALGSVDSSVCRLL